MYVKRTCQSSNLPFANIVSIEISRVSSGGLVTFEGQGRKKEFEGHQQAESRDIRITFFPLEGYLRGHIIG